MKSIRRTNRWRGISGVALLAGALGVLFSRPLVLLSGVVGVAFAAYARTAGTPEPALDVTRTVSDGEPLPGDEVQVRLTVENVGGSMLADVRVVDGVPDALPVVSGSARLGTALRPGKSATLTYAVEAERGDHEFDPATAIVRDFSGAIEVEQEVETETKLRCVPKLGTTVDVPLRAQTTQYTGRVTTDAGGSGVEFHATREYRPGDPLSRVDWNRLARTGEVTTIDFREERAASVVVLVDTREKAYLSRDAESRNAVQYGVDAAGKVVTKLLDAGDRVGLASLGPESCWLAPGAGHDHQARARSLLATHPAFAPTPGDGMFYPTTRLKQIRKRLPASTQVVFVTPLCDDFGPDVARRLDAEGHLVTVVSPDPTATDTAGQRFARTQRKHRVSKLRQAGIRVVDWDVDEQLGVALARMARVTGGVA
ncbi:DUF58 domain-containing protein [Halorussus gelatinilyticus]|uniref:DUF58 domain-containing protein n=1 Tax=Halorussus gelatinilyticus TaxID=2937524 RepID=A0A8U0IE53_9EURY|nr:DUF58 domain-containing protein [Halorussus gelatinilyticus]UPV98995.1 DUF58 domain-containing protein [Halorussus gelatinilyticus]